MILRHVPLGGVLGQSALVKLGDPVGFRTWAAAEASAHALDAHRHATLGRPNHDRLGDAMQGLHAGAALAVRIKRRDLGGEPGEARDRIATDAGQLRRAGDVAKADVLDHVVGHLL
ncbi:MAG: hypothetical protein R3B97_14850 [Dehalococcoidia bacterium]